MVKFSIYLNRRVFVMVAFVLSLLLPRLSFVLCLGKAVLRDCGISRVSSLSNLKMRIHSKVNLFSRLFLCFYFFYFYFLFFIYLFFFFVCLFVCLFVFCCCCFVVVVVFVCLFYFSKTLFELRDFVFV